MTHSRYTKHHHTALLRLIDAADDQTLDYVVADLWACSGGDTQRAPSDVLRLFRVALQQVVKQNSPAQDDESHDRRKNRESYTRHVAEIDSELARRDDAKRAIDQLGTRRKAGVL